MIAKSTHSRLLLVEQNTIPALDRRHFLEKSGYRVVRVEAGEAAIHLLDRGEGFCAAIVDVELSGAMNAADTAAALRERRSMPIVFLGRSEAAAGESVEDRFDAVSYAPRGEASRLLPVLQDLGLRPSRKSQPDSTAKGGRVSGPEYGAYFYESIVRTISDVVAVIDDEGIVRYKSPSIETQFGRKPGEATGVSAFEFVHPDDREAVIALVNRILEESSRNEEIEFRYPLPDGTYVWVEGRVTGYSDAKIPRGVIVSYQDISERVKAREALEKALREKKLLLSEVHHRMKNDLNLVNAMLSLQAGRSEATESTKALEAARHRIGVMGQIYDQLYRSEFVGEVDLKALVSRLVDDMRRAGVHSNVHIQIDVFSIRLSTRLALSVGLIVNEIVTNSLKYAAPDGGPVEITGSIGPTHEGGSVEISIRDSGPGFPAELIERRSEGLGTTIVRELAEQHKGEVSLENDSGAVVYVRLPVKK